ncbi:MAG TPA: hypothetical protein VMM78_05365, partial [Thermomicrobiales bacterium]|nr:hypothetical protein [Thermomicrobiales bacterium]
PGEYITSVAIQNAVPTGDDGEGVVLKQIVRQVIAIAIDVPGERAPTLAIDGVTYGDVGSMSVVAFDVQNPGNVLLKPVAEMVLFDAGGVEVDRQSMQMGSFYAWTDTKVEFAFRERLPVGNYTAILTVTDTATGATASTAQPLGVTVPEAVESIIIPAPAAQTTAPVASAAPAASQPWALVAVAVVATLAVVGAIAGGIVLFRRLKSRPRTEQAQPVHIPAPAPVATSLTALVSIRRLVPPGYSQH